MADTNSGSNPMGGGSNSSAGGGNVLANSPWGRLFDIPNVTAETIYKGFGDAIGNGGSDPLANNPQGAEVLFGGGGNQGGSPLSNLRTNIDRRTSGSTNTSSPQGGSDIVPQSAGEPTSSVDGSDIPLATGDSGIPSFGGGDNTSGTSGFETRVYIDNLVNDELTKAGLGDKLPTTQAFNSGSNPFDPSFGSSLSNPGAGGNFGGGGAGGFGGGNFGGGEGGAIPIEGGGIGGGPEGGVNFGGGAGGFGGGGVNFGGGAGGFGGGGANFGGGAGGFGGGIGSSGSSIPSFGGTDSFAGGIQSGADGGLSFGGSTGGANGGFPIADGNIPFA